MRASGVLAFLGLGGSLAGFTLAQQGSQLSEAVVTVNTSFVQTDGQEAAIIKIGIIEDENTPETSVLVHAHAPDGDEIVVEVDLDYVNSGWGSRPHRPSDVQGSPSSSGAPSASASQSGDSGTSIGNTASSGSSESPSVPPKQLNPALLPGLDPYDPGHLVASPNLTMYYNESNPDTTDPAYAVVHIPFCKYPTIMADNSALITSIVCDAHVCTFTFANLDALRTTVANWEKLEADYHGIIIATSLHGVAHNDSLTERAYLFIEDITSEDDKALTLTCDYELFGFEQIVDPNQNITIGIGHGNEPGAGSSAPGTPWDTGSGSGTSVSVPPSGGSGGNSSTSPAAGGNTTEVPGCLEGEDFDICLDRLAGYMPTTDYDFNQLLPGIDDDTASDYDYVDDAAAGDLSDYDYTDDYDQGFTEERRSLRFRKRWSLKAKFFTAVLDGVAKGLKTVGLNKAAQKVEAAKVTVIDALAKIDQALEKYAGVKIKPVVANLPINLQPKNLTSTKWGDAKLLYKKSSDTEKYKNTEASISLYCVGCKATGLLKIDSTIIFTLGAGITTAQASLTGNMFAGFGLGLIAEYKYEYKPDPVTIASVPLTPVSIGSLASIGPVVTVKAQPEFILAAEGSILGNMSLSWPAVNANVDIFSPEKTAFTGFQPQINTGFQAEGEIVANATMYGIISLGLSLKAFKYEVGVSVNEKPGLRVSAKLAASSQEGGLTDETCIKALIVNNLYIGVQRGVAPEKEYPLIKDWESTPVAKCLKTSASNNNDTKSAARLRRTIELARRASTADSPQTVSNVTAITSNGTAHDQPAATPTTDGHLSESSPTGSLNATGTVAVSDGATVLPSISSNVTATASAESSVDTGAPDQPTNNTDGQPTTFVVIASADHQFILAYGENGNIYVTSSNNTNVGANGFFGFEKDIVWGSGDARILHSYVDELKNYGVARLRLSEVDQLPTTAVEIALSSIKYTDSQTGKDAEALIAFDSAGDAYYPVVCVYNDSALFPKIFLVNDPEAGSAKLEDPALEGTLTGSSIHDCSFVPWTVLQS